MAKRYYLKVIGRVASYYKIPLDNLEKIRTERLRQAWNPFGDALHLSQVVRWKRNCLNCPDYKEMLLESLVPQGIGGSGSCPVPEADAPPNKRRADDIISCRVSVALASSLSEFLLLVKLIMKEAYPEIFPTLIAVLDRVITQLDERRF